ncbi:MAG TPA: 16S rRNA (guanine(966)-N(2))-methyltransferase RsmD [Oligoflexus sp.]|uniref:16S rRNA (guanine(966)-N(2))-methyltransferase RsmD n=1 Tax=Oligoflexus sp. TaxID=1971216 RepID=UPI002D2E5DD3|nr:16S rRNA (guanine(966)-N(2))-methyltransferase RsmD [Oligoflexus sp.]HYX35555.1 16S rRNA (guanine(966)-N(2))-methyltransferase RsmD [Oligoflexus sp.]
MSLRLSSGFCQGMRLENPASVTRPTASRVRSAIWNTLQLRLPGARVLDICAGSGAVGIEALSRGASRATFVEQDKAALKALQRNLAEVERRAKNQGLTVGIQVLGKAAEQALTQCPTEGFDILWIDPPFAIISELLPRLVSELNRLGAEDSTLVVESDSADLEKIPALLDPTGQGMWDLHKQKAYGKIGVSFFSKRKNVA